jgi:gliding motility-associated lipoprotein GldD
MQKTRITLIMKVLAITVLVACGAGCTSGDVDTPRPRGYFRITFPAKQYRVYDSLSPFTFEYPRYAVLKVDTDFNHESNWYNLEFPAMKATLHLSYKVINHDILKLLEDSRTLVYKHTVKAEAIDESLIIDNVNKKYGIYYIIKGDAASSFQFIVTDSCRHFMRGALYFNVVPNKDSLAPSLAFIRQDVEHLVQSLRWK